MNQILTMLLDLAALTFRLPASVLEAPHQMNQKSTMPLDQAVVSVLALSTSVLEAIHHTNQISRMPLD